MKKFILIFVILSFLINCNFVYADLTDDLKAYWKMDESSGNIIDAHNSNDGIPSGSPTYSQAGKIGTSILFEDSTIDYFTVQNSADLTLSINMTISFWLKHPSQTITQYLLNKGTHEEDGYYLVIFSTEKLAFVTSQDGMDLVQHTRSSTTIPDDVLVHILVVVTNGTCRLYFNNVEVSYEAQPTHINPLDGETLLRIGARQPGDYSIDGNMDEIGFWNRAITSDERAELYNGGEGFAYPFVVDTCTAPETGVWNIDCSDNCSWTDAQNIPSNITITGSGHLKLSDVFTFVGSNQYISIGSGCSLEIMSGGETQ